MRTLHIILFIVLYSNSISAQSGFDAQMRQAGLVDVATLDSTLCIQLMYATDDNFMGKNVYGDLRAAYLLPHFAHKVVTAQRLLREQCPGWQLLVCDAARPISVQRTMYALVENTPNAVYVANATRGGRHNYGVAVDVTLLDASGKEVDMGTPVDFMGDASHIDKEDSLVLAGAISAAAVANRSLLISLMREAGLVPYRREWWHFEEPMRMSDVRAKYQLLDF